MNDYFKNIQQKNFKVNVYKSPVAAAFWSACLPGFGQFYVRDYTVGIILGVWEIGLNLMTNLNLSIYYSFTGELQKSLEVVDWQWGLFYPSVYVFNIWHAYDRANVINSELEERGVPKPNNYSKNQGVFIGLFLGMFTGLHWNFLVSPVFSDVVLGVGLGGGGYLIEKIVSKAKG